MKSIFRSSWFTRRRLREPTAIGIAPPDGSFDAPPGHGWQVLESDMAARMYRNDMQLMFNFGAGGAVRGIKGAIANFAHLGSTSRRQTDRVTGLAAQTILAPIEQEVFNVQALAVQGNFEKGFRRWLRNSLLFVDQTEITDADVVKALWSNPGHRAAI